MPTTKPAVQEEDPIALTLADLADRYPTTLGDTELAGDLVERLRHYLQRLHAGRLVADGHATLLRLVELTEDAGAGNELMEFYLARMAGHDAPLPQWLGLLHNDLGHVARQNESRKVRRAQDLAEIEPVSGLPNHAALVRSAQHLIDEAKEEGLQVAALCVLVRDQSRTVGQPGHASEEELSRAIAARIRAVTKKSDVIGVAERRESNNSQFTVILPRLRSIGGADYVGNRIVESLRLPLDIEGEHIELSSAVGWSAFPVHAETAGGLVRTSRSAAREALSTGGMGGLSVVQYTSAADSDDWVSRALEADLRHAISENALTLYFQPQMDLETRAVTSVEALLRWERHPGEWINPESVIACAETCGLIGDLSLWIVGAAARQVDAWSQEQLDITVSVNLTATSLIDKDLPQLINRRLKNADVDAKRLRLEITESSMIADPERSKRIINELRNVGLTIAIDDFGVGYGSMKWLRDLPIDELKIDKTFVQTMLTKLTNDQVPNKDAIMVESLIKLAHAFKVIVVAEGVEDEATCECLKRMECDRIQGYWLSPPLPAEKCSEFLHAHARLSSLQADKGSPKPHAPARPST